MSPKRARGVAVAFATPAPVDPNAAGPIHSACARRADDHGGVTQKAVLEILRQVYFGHDVGFTRNTIRANHLESVAEKSGVPVLARLLGARNRGDGARSRMGASGPRQGQA